MVLITLINFNVSYIYFKELKYINSILILLYLLYPFNNTKMAHREMNATILVKQEKGFRIKTMVL